MTKSGPAHIYSDDGTLDPNSGASVYVNLLMEAMAKCGRPFLDASRLRQLLEDAGFVAVESFAIKQPWGPWARDRKLKQVGAMFLQQSESGETDTKSRCVGLTRDLGFEAYGIAPFTRILGLSHQDAAKVCRDALDDIKNKNTHVYNFLWVPRQVPSVLLPRVG